MVAPLLALLPLLTESETTGDALGSFLFAVLVIGLIIIINRFLLRHVFSFLAAADSREILTAAALLLVLVTALAAEAAGLSMALGAFLAGVLLADSEFRHELEANIEPFKSMLLGLFFIAIGMMIDVHLLFNQPLVVLLCVSALITIKGLVLYCIGRLQGLGNRSSFLVASNLCQGGEFAFVIITVAVGHQLVSDELNSLIIMVVSLSMALTPLLAALVEYTIPEKESSATAEAEVPDQLNPVIIAGFGRVGQIVARILAIKHIPFTALESRSEQVNFVRQYGNKIYYGDTTRLEVLKSAGLAQARVMILAIQNIEASIKTATLVTRNFPQIQLYARARNRKHGHLLQDAGVQHVTRDTLHSSLHMAKEILQNLGNSMEDATKVVDVFRQYDENLFQRQHAYHQDQKQLIQSAREVQSELRDLFQQDQQG